MRGRFLPTSSSSSSSSSSSFSFFFFFYFFLGGGGIRLIMGDRGGGRVQKEKNIQIAGNTEVPSYVVISYKKMCSQMLWNRHEMK